MNPILPKEFYIPDVEARQWKDGRVYLYGSFDDRGADYYCSKVYHVFSSSDLKEWTDHGVSFTGYAKGENRAAVTGVLYAPDCICLDEKYYLFYCQAHNGEGVAVSDNPAGPFTDAVPVEYADQTQIDPAVFADDDGTVYYYWGQHSAKAAVLRQDRRGLVRESIVDGVLTEQEHGFHEGISVRKRNGVYYLVYTDTSRGSATCIAYATGNSPTGPFRKRGILIDNTGCDPMSWNNHGSIAEINGQWYLFYHRSTHNSKFSRRVCAEPIFFDENGLIQEVEMTTQGMEGPLSPRIKMEASNACLLSGGVYIDSAEQNGNVYEFLGHMRTGDWAAYKYYRFAGRERSVQAEGLVYSPCRISVHLDSPDGVCVAALTLTPGLQGQKSVARAEMTQKTYGIHAVYLVFFGNGQDFAHLISFHFD